MIRNQLPLLAGAATVAAPAAIGALVRVWRRRIDERLDAVAHLRWRQAVRRWHTNQHGGRVR